MKRATEACVETELAAVACGLAAVAMVAWLLILASRGLEFSDEGFYLTWLAQPGNLPVSVTQFGFVYHPVYRLLDGDIAALRRFNVLLTFGLAFWMFDAFLRDVRGATRWMRAAVAMALACSSLAVLSPWLLTPNYNTLCVQSFLLAMVGVAMLDGARWRAGAALLGLGGALAFLAKPSSAAMLGASMLGVLVFLRRGHRAAILLLAPGVAAGIVLAAAFVIDGDPLRFVERLRTANEGWQRLVGWRGFDTLFRWDPFALSVGEKTLIAAGAAAALLAGAGLGASTRAVRVAAAVAAAAAALLSFAWLCANHPVLPRTQFVATVLCAPALSILAFAALAADWRKLAQGACIACLPAAYAFGTNNHYWQAGSVAGVFWIAGAAAAARDTHISIWPPATALGLLASAMLLLQGATAPYRQVHPILEQHTPVAIPDNAALWIAQDSASYVEALRNGAKSAGWIPGTPAIDLTGQSPTALHLLQARALGYAWWIGGYEGSDDAARWMVARLPCEDLAAAWLLHEPDGPRALSADLPREWGLDIARDYAVAARFQTPPGAGDYPEPRTQVLLRPERDVASASVSCNQARAARREGAPP